MPGYDQFQWNMHYFHGSPYWVRNFKTKSGVHQGRVYKSGDDYRTETYVYIPDKPVTRGPSHLVTSLKDAKDAVDEYFDTL